MSVSFDVFNIKKKETVLNVPPLSLIKNTKNLGELQICIVFVVLIYFVDTRRSLMKICYHILFRAEYLLMIKYTSIFIWIFLFTVKSNMLF